MSSIPAPAPRLSRNALIVGGVVIFHVAALWALQAGLLRRVVEVVVPAALISEIITPAEPKAEPSPPQPKVEARPVRQQVTPKAPTPVPAPQPVAIADPTPAPAAPSGVVTPQPPVATVAAAPSAPAAAPAPPAPPAPARIEMPSSDADYLQNPAPPYPPASKRRGEQGSVLVHVLVGADGSAQKADLRKSSGFDRLDAVAVATALKWRYVPGKRNGVAEAMWVTVPINFELEK